MDVKLARDFEVKDAARGEVVCVFATTRDAAGNPVVDRDGDIYADGAFEHGAGAALSPFGHKVWEGVPPLGKGTVHVTRTEAQFHGRYFVGIPEARDQFELVKEMGVDLQWSFGYTVLDEQPAQVAGRRVRRLNRVQVDEVSPVWRGAGVGTRTLAAKAADDLLGEHLRFIRWRLDQAAAADRYDLAAIRDRWRAAA